MRRIVIRQWKLFLAVAMVLQTDCVMVAFAVDFNVDVRPILSDKCFPCHGPDEATREADLRLDTAAGAFKDRGGYFAFNVDNPEESEALLRILSDDPDILMPPSDSKLRLTDAEKNTLQDWVEGGAHWSDHWSFVAPQMPAVPSDDSGWSRNEIDRFVLARAKEAGVAPNRDASPESQIRRATLDLTGLPPTLQEVDAFVADPSDEAYEGVIDRLLASPQYGERMAWEWLDAARFADTDGFQGDPTRTMWPWRDWLVDALNNNMPFDQFTIEMLAGDLVDNASPEQILATAFNRNHLFNGEGGRIAEETRVENVFDRAETTATVWLGLTLTCCRCHDHKYDRITQQEYYQLYAFFNNTSETGRSNRKGTMAPALEYLNPQQRERLKERGDTSAVNATTVMVMDQLPKDQVRTTRILERGSYDKPLGEVRADTPAFLPPLHGNAPPDRLALAQWLIRGDNPLTARVTVNRYWQTFFGRGIVASTEDFGSQGTRPTHPLLLDWLARKFMASGWDVKNLHRQIVLSSTYRQSSRVSAGALATDPENKWLARSPRHRLPSWMLRDQALAVSGLLVDRLGGPPVKPYQPDGVWAEATFGKIRYEPDSGANLYRRSLYIFWRRIVGPTLFFDEAKRQTCEVRQTRTNTPLHALTTLNETAFVESARAMAQRAMLSGDADEQRIVTAFRLATARRPRDKELQVLLKRLGILRQDFATNAEDTAALLDVGESERDKTVDAAEHAAFTVLCSLILNLDETLSKP